MSAVRTTLVNGERIRPARTFAEFEQAMPGTRHTPQTYASFQLARNEVPAKAIAEGVGAKFKVTNRGNPEIYKTHKGVSLRIVHVGDNWVWAVPDSYVENFWQ